MIYQSIDQLIEAARSSVAEPKGVAVAAAEDPHVLEAVCRAEQEGVIKPYLIGDSTKIRDILKGLGASADKLEILDSPDVDASARMAVELVRRQKATLLMKGLLNTSNMLRAVLNKEAGLERGPVLSHISINEAPAYHKLFVVTDAGILIQPGLEEKKAIILNAVNALHRMGCETPKVAVLAALESVNPKMPETADAAALKAMSLRGEIPGCIVEGPISMDLAMDRGAAGIKGFSSPVVGDADIFVVPSLACGNILNKSLRFFAKSRQVGIVMGAQVPIILTSRGATAESKYLSIMVTAAMA